jgi:tetratricopeptide (TPR) repeat protein
MGEKINHIFSQLLRMNFSKVFSFSLVPTVVLVRISSLNQNKSQNQFRCDSNGSPSPASPVVASSGRGRRVLLTLALLASTLAVSPFLHAAGESDGFLQWGAGARSLGIGRAFIAVADDASATYWNPAAMVQLQQKELMGLQATLFEDTSFTFLSYVHPSSKLGAWGFNMTRLSSGGFEKLQVKIDPASSPSNPNFLSVEQVGSYVVSEQAMTFAYGKQITNKLAMGLALKRISKTIDTFSQSFMGVDLSVFSKVNENYRIGFAARNAVTQAPADTDDRLPLTLRFGNAYSMLNQRLILAADLTSGQGSGFGWNVGTEYKATRRTSFRMGLESRGSGIAETTAGLGFVVKNINLDLGVGITELGMSQRISVSWKFGQNANKDRGEEARRLIKAGENAFNKGSYAQALTKLEAALSVDPSNKDLQNMVNKMLAIAGTIPAASGDGETDRLVRQGVSAYVGGDLSTAYDSLRTAYEKNPSSQNLMNFTNRIARQAGMPTVEPPRDSMAGARWTLVDQKLHDALTAIYEGRYDVSIAKCEQVLRIDPNNVTAIGRMGASFFLLGEKDKAVTLWKRALELEPNNQTAIDYLRQMGAYQE